MRWVVHGAGAVGGTIGGRLHQHGHDVVLVARGEHGRAVREDGLLLRDPDGEARLDVPCVEHPSQVDWRDDDVVLLAVKTQHTPAALDDLHASAPPGLHVVCAQNGVENERLALRRYADVHAMCVMLPAEHVQPGVVDASSAPVTGILDVGRCPSGTDDVDEALAEALSSSTFRSRPDPAVLRLKHAKLLMNLGNALEAACGTAGRHSDLLRRAQEEARACFAAAGVDCAGEQEDRARRGDLVTVRPVAGSVRGGGSSWQSLARGTGSIEADWLNGEVVLLGRLHGVPTPVNALLQRVAVDLARRGAPPGSTTVQELEAQL